MLYSMFLKWRKPCYHDMQVGILLQSWDVIQAERVGFFFAPGRHLELSMSSAFRAGKSLIKHYFIKQFWILIRFSWPKVFRIPFNFFACQRAAFCSSSGFTSLSRIRNMSLWQPNSLVSSNSQKCMFRHHSMNKSGCEVLLEVSRLFSAAILSTIGEMPGHRTTLFDGIIILLWFRIGAHHPHTKYPAVFVRCETRYQKCRGIHL